MGMTIRDRGLFAPAFREFLGGRSYREVATEASVLCSCTSLLAQARIKGYIESYATLDKLAPRNKRGEFVGTHCPSIYGIYAAILTLHIDDESIEPDHSIDLLKLMIACHEPRGVADLYCRRVDEGIKHHPDPKIYLVTVRDYLLELDRETRGIDEV